MLVTSDMEMNGVNYRFRARPAAGAPSEGCAAGTSGCFDTESVVLHEAGHFIGLNHVSCADAVMFPQGSGSSERTALSIHEQSAICKLYPPRPLSVATNRFSGEHCTTNGDCPEGLCITPKGLEGSYWGWCSRVCDCTDGCARNCPQAFVCAQQQNGTIKFCKPGVHLTGGAVTGGCACDVDGGCSSGCACDDECVTCTSNANCAGGMVCAGGNCTTCSTSGQCTGGQICNTSGRCAACTASTQCASGQVCSGGTCVNCTNSTQCSNGQICNGSGRCADCTSSTQ
jgi:hypothetical protein